MINKIKDYVKKLNNEYVQGNATEHSYRPALKDLLETDDVTATNEPGAIAFGKPDFEMKRGGNTFGFVEAKDVPVDLDEDTEQFQRYIDALDNLIYTNYIEFRLYINKQQVNCVKIAKVKNGKIEIIIDNINDLVDLLITFKSQSIIPIGKSDVLAEKLAFNAHLIEDKILDALNDTSNSQATTELKNQYVAFQENLILGLTERDFASMFAQTVCYGLFAAWVNMIDYLHFTTKDAGAYLPKTTPFLKDFFNLISIGNFKDTIGWIIDNVSNILAHCDKGAVLEHFGTFNYEEDPIIHFYQTFLLKFDRDYKDQYGAYYTPKPVVEYIVKSIDYILKTEFNQQKGLASEEKLDSGKYKVQILDPATGTGTFVSSVIDIIYEQFRSEPSLWRAYVKDCLLERLHAFEFMMAPYTITHMQIDNQLKKTGVDLSAFLEEGQKRLKVFLCDTLQEPYKTGNQNLLFQGLKNEITESDEVKQKTPIMVIFGNPPYSVSSANMNNKYICDEVRDNYYPKGEKKLNLQDDYVKFFRFAQKRIDETGYGILGFITNNGYLSGRTFRQMRKSLMNTFDKIYLLNLHGKSLINETCPDGSPDENAFDIRVGTSICIMIKHKETGERFVKYQDLYGLRKDKFEFLLEKESIKNTNFENIEPQDPFFMFVPKNYDLVNEYNSFMPVTDIMKIHINGIETQRDKLAIDIKYDILLKKIEDFKNLDINAIKEKYNFKNTDWIDDCKANLIIDENEIKQITYRPFDNRYIYYSDSGLIGRRRYDVMKHMLKDNLSFLTQQGGCSDTTIGVTKYISDKHAFNTGTVIPFYIYEEENNNLLGFEIENKTPNLSQDFINLVEEATGLTYREEKENQDDFNSMDVFKYIYGLLSSKEYREKYIEFIDIDYPRVPAPKNKDLFFQIGEIGARLMDLHLMNIENQSDDIKFMGVGDDKVEKVEFDPGEKKLKINKSQYFTGVTQEIYDFNMGGYEVLSKYLSYRKKMTLGLEEMKTVKNIIYIIKNTLELTKELSPYAKEQIN